LRLARLGEYHGAQGAAARNLALGNQVLEDLGRIAGADPPDFVDAARGEL
jgi:hypothetical protein